MYIPPVCWIINSFVFSLVFTRNLIIQARLGLRPFIKMKLACKVVSQVLNFLMSYPELSITFKNHSSWFDWGLDNA